MDDCGTQVTAAAGGASRANRRVPPTGCAVATKTRRLRYDRLEFCIAIVIYERPITFLALICSLRGYRWPPSPAATVAASSIPDGTYTVKVEKVVDPKHSRVAMDNGNETTLGAGRDSVDFSKVQQDDQLKVSLISGSVMVYADLTAH